MTFSLTEQSISLVYAVILGLALGAVYDLLKIIRLTLNNKKWLTFTLDIVFMLLFTFATVIFSMGYSRGSARYYILMGEAVGFLLFRFTLGRVILKLWGKFLPIFRKYIKIVTEFMRKTLKKLLQRNNNILYNKDGKKDNSPKLSAEE